MGELDTMELEDGDKLDKIIELKKKFGEDLTYGDLAELYGYEDPSVIKEAVGEKISRGKEDRNVKRKEDDDEVNEENNGVKTETVTVGKNKGLADRGKEERELDYDNIYLLLAFLSMILGAYMLLS